MLIWVLQSSHCFKIRLAQHCGRRGANVSENEGVRSECKKFGEIQDKWLLFQRFVTSIVASILTPMNATTGFHLCFFKQQSGALTICMENPKIPGRIQMERFIPVEIFRKKSSTFRGITFFPVLTETTEILCTICLDYPCQASCREKVKNLPVFCKINGTTQSRSCFRCQTNTSTI